MLENNGRNRTIIVTRTTSSIIIWEQRTRQSALLLASIRRIKMGALRWNLSGKRGFKRDQKSLVCKDNEIDARGPDLDFRWIRADRIESKDWYFESCIDFIKNQRWF